MPEEAARAAWRIASERAMKAGTSEDGRCMVVFVALAQQILALAGRIHASAGESMLNSDSRRASLIRIGLELDFRNRIYISVLHPQEIHSFP